MSTETKNKSALSNEKQLKLLRQALRLSVKELQSFREISLKHSNVILNQDISGKELSKKNQEKYDTFKNKKMFKNTDEKLEQSLDIVFRNFDIQNATIEIIKAYVDEYFERFLVLEKHLTRTFSALDKYLESS